MLSRSFDPAYSIFPLPCNCPLLPLCTPADKLIKPRLAWALTFRVWAYLDLEQAEFVNASTPRAKSVFALQNALSKQVDGFLEVIKENVDATEFLRVQRKVDQGKKDARVYSKQGVWDVPCDVLLRVKPGVWADYANKGIWESWLGWGKTSLQAVVEFKVLQGCAHSNVHANNTRTSKHYTRTHITHSIGFHAKFTCTSV
jgi:hypothetical protein